MTADQAGSETSARTAELAALASLLVVTLVNVGLYWPAWGGDPEIHLVFARNLLAGHPLQFNQGEFSSGETSPVYMLLLAACIALIGTPGTAVFMKVAGVLSAGFIAWQIQQHARFRGHETSAARVLAWSFLAVPAVAFQALLGMENMLFAACAAWLVRSMLEARLDHAATRHRIALSWALFVLFYLRPEAVFIMAALVLHAIQTRDRGLGLSVLVSAALVALSVLALQAWTDVPLMAAGEARAVLGRVGALPWSAFGHTLYLQTKLLGIGVWFLPFVLALGLRARVQTLTNVDRRVFLSLIALPLILHALNLLPTLHLTRYLLYALASLYLVTCGLLRSLPRKRLAISLLACALAASSIENIARYRSRRLPLALGWKNSLNHLAPEHAGDVSTRLCRELHCSNAPITLAVIEVQMRLHLDHRFIIRSLDGSVDAKLADFVRPWGIDHFAYLKAREVDYLLAFPSYNLDPSAPTLAQLTDLEVAGVRSLQGLRFERVPSASFPRVIRMSPENSD